jgi:putative transposase
MSRAYFRVGVRVTIFRELYRFDRQTTDGVWVLEHETTRRPLERTPEQLLEHYAQRQLAFVRTNLPSIAGTSPQSDAVVTLGAEALKVYRYRLAFVKATQQLPATQSKLTEAIAKSWAAMNEDQRPPRPPHWSTVHRWVRAYERAGGDTRVLISNDGAKGNRSERFPDEVIQVCEEEIEQVYLTEERPALTDVTNLAQGRVRKLNRARPPSDQLPMPSVALMKTVLQRNHNAFDIHAKRYGRDAANHKFRAVLHLRQTHAALARGEIDHSQLDIMAIDDDTGVPLGRPYLTLLIDSHTRCILGLCLSFEPPSSSTVAQCLKHAFMPKRSFKEHFHRLVHEWEQFGIVLELVMDGGPEFYSYSLEQFLQELDVHPHWSPRKTPWFKGRIERFNKSLNTGVSAATPGKTFTNIFERADYDPKKHAVMTMSALEELIYVWINDVYHRKTHSALGCSPAKMWKQSIRPHEIAVMADPDRVDALIGTEVKRSLDHTGVVYKGLDYNSAELVEVRREVGAEIKDIRVRFNKSDLGSVVVLHPITEAPIRAQCLRQDYADGLTEWQHDLCRRYAGEQGWDEDDPDSWLDALVAIHDLVQDQQALWGGKVHTGRRVARWKQALARKAAKAQASTQKVPPQHRSPQPPPPPKPKSKPRRAKETEATAKAPAANPAVPQTVPMPRATPHRSFTPEIKS